MWVVIHWPCLPAAEPKTVRVRVRVRVSVRVRIRVRVRVRVSVRVRIRGWGKKERLKWNRKNGWMGVIELNELRAGQRRGEQGRGEESRAEEKVDGNTKEKDT